MKQVLRDAAAELREPMNWVLVAVLFAFFALGQRLDAVGSKLEDPTPSVALRDAIHTAAATERKDRAAAAACYPAVPVWIDATTHECAARPGKQVDL